MHFPGARQILKVTRCGQKYEDMNVFAVTIISTCLGRLSVTFWCVAVFFFLLIEPKVVRQPRCIGCSWHFSPPQKYSVELRPVLCAGH